MNNGDGGPASAAYLSNPTSVSVDREGNLFIADGLRIRKVNASGIITTVAGNGYSGYTGDGGLATEASITHASGITFDNKGNFYFSQYYGEGDVIRKVTDNGYISTVAGAGQPGMDGDYGPATHALLQQPQRLVIDPYGFIYIPDKGNGLVRKVSIDSYMEGETHFVESNGLGHLISADGYHQQTYDLETGLTLRSFGYNADKQLTSITDQFGNVVNIEYSFGVPAAIVSPDGLRTELKVDNYNQLNEIRYPDNSAFVFEYQNNDGLLTAKNEPNGNRFEHDFDEKGRVVQTSDQEGGIWQFSRGESYDGIAKSTIATPNTSKSVESITYPDGAFSKKVTEPGGEVGYTYTSSDGLDTSVQSTCGSAVQLFSDLDRWYGYIYTSSARMTTPAGLEMNTTVDRTYTDANADLFPEEITTRIALNDKISTRVHDVVNATYTINSPENRTMSSSYTPNTLQTTSLSIPGMYDTHFNYLGDGKLSSVTSGSRTVRYTYDSKGNLASVIDPLNQVTSFTEYDEVGRVTRMQRADGTVLQYQYDQNGNMTLLTTPKPADNHFSYNGVNNPAAFRTPLGNTTSYSYNQERRLTKVVLPSAKEIVNTYTDGRLVETATSEWTNTYSYACGNLLDTVTRGSESISYTWDADLPTGIAQRGTLNADLGFSYNNDFKITSFSYAGATTAFQYDNDGLLTGAGNFLINRNSANGLPETVTDSAYSLNRSYTGYGEIGAIGVSLSGSQVYSYGLTRDAGGRISEKIETVDGVPTPSVYSYDERGQLLTVTRNSVLTEEYRYDNNGNRTYEMNSDLGISGRSYTSSVEDHTITAGDITYTFDYDDYLASRIQGGETTEYFYSSTGELQSVTLPDGTAITYINDPEGRRIAKKVNGITVEKYLWTGQTTLLAVYDGSNNLLQRFEYADGRMPYAMSAGGATYYLAYDQVGTLRLVTDSSGNIVKRIDYDSFGNIINDSNPAFNVSFGFAGGLHDRDTGLVRFGYRDYLPEIGKWTAKDPILFAGGDANLYGYVQNDPVNFVDPWGLDPDWGKFFRYTNTVTGPFKSNLQKGIDAADNWVKKKALNKLGIPTPVAKGVLGNALGLGVGTILLELTNPTTLGDGTLNAMDQDGDGIPDYLDDDGC